MMVTAHTYPLEAHVDKTQAETVAADSTQKYTF